MILLFDFYYVIAQVCYAMLKYVIWIYLFQIVELVFEKKDVVDIYGRQVHAQSQCVTPVGVNQRP